MCPQDGPEFFVTPLTDQVLIHLTDSRQEPVRVVQGRRRLPVRHPNAVVRYGIALDDRHPHAIAFVGCGIGSCRRDDFDRVRERAQRPDRDRAVEDVRSEHLVWVVVQAASHGGENTRINREVIGQGSTLPQLSPERGMIVGYSTANSRRGVRLLLRRPVMAVRGTRIHVGRLRAS